MSPVPSTAMLQDLQARIVSALDPSLLRAPYDGQWTTENPTAGFCSVASEAAWFLLGGKQAGWVAHHARDLDGSTHWWLMHETGVRFDPTADQYRCVGKVPPYERGIPGTAGGFMGMRRDPDSPWGNERKPGLRAQALLERMDAIPKLDPKVSRPRVR